MRPDEIARVKLLLDDATPGPLDVSVWGMTNGLPEEWVIADKGGVIAHVYRESDAQLWAVAREALPQALEEITRLTARLEAALDILSVAERYDAPGELADAIHAALTYDRAAPTEG